ncbi:hypothetical protein Microterr_29370 [Microbacterium terricola]|uniref:Uncharacterized protein n=1 Tax=Microbacterium terricola TaxID=344163 RepID=A0ABM8E2T0_9MICO|nr:hypothetical protein Microterr_29370 [Microbacterium terricola]
MVVFRGSPLERDMEDALLAEMHRDGDWELLAGAVHGDRFSDLPGLWFRAEIAS